MANATDEIKSRYLKLLGENPPFFINSDYTLEQFAVALGTNRSYASRFINTELGLTFPALLNKLRLAHFLRLKNENPKNSIKDTALKCGFKNSFSFRRAFKAEYGMTPSGYLNKNKL